MLHLCTLFPVCVLSQEEAKRLNEEQISELQVEVDRPETLLEDERQKLQRKVSGLPIDRRHTHTYEYTHTHVTVFFSRE